MKNIYRNLISLIYMISIPMLSIFYTLLNNSNRGVSNLVTDIDREIPFLKVFVIPYISWYAFIFFTLCYICIKDKFAYYRTLIAINISLAICYLIYFFYQTTVPRPLILGDDILTRLLTYVFTTDKPFNCFPSIHCLTSYLMMKTINNSEIKTILNRIIINGIALLIIFSTLFIKQHVLVDVLFAILLGDVIFEMVYNWDGVKYSIWKIKRYLLLTMKKKLEI